MGMGMGMVAETRCMRAAGEEKLRVSGIFVDFLAHWMDGGTFPDSRWCNQLSEELSDEGRLAAAMGSLRLERLLLDGDARLALERAREWFQVLTTEDKGLLRSFHDRVRFMVVVGAPRNGGSYLTAELFSALGYQAPRVPVAIAHDGFPDAQPFSLKGGANSWMDCLRMVGEYLTAVELFFLGSSVAAPVVVPKKATKAIYAGRLFREVFGRTAHYIVTVRHPIASCISTYEKSGGLPVDGKFCVRSTLESWIRRDIFCSGVSPGVLAEMDYFEAYVRYWERFHVNLAMSELLAHRSYTIVPYGRDSMEAIANSFHTRFESDHNPTHFESHTRLDGRHPQWIGRALEALDRVESAWQIAGLCLPRSKLAECA